MKQLEEMNEYKTKMLASVSHELRTPLNCSITMLDILVDKVNQDLRDNYVVPALISNKLLINTINDILDFA